MLTALYIILIVFFDLKIRKIPNVICIFFISISLISSGIHSGVDGIFGSIYGFFLGFSLLIFPFLLSGMGAGDVKAMAALGALIGPSAIFQTFLYTALVGGAISLVYYVVVYDVREKARAGLAAMGAFAFSRDVRCLIPETPKKKHKIPYAPAMALGYLAYLAWGNLV